MGRARYEAKAVLHRAKITVDSYGLVYVADHENQRVQVFDDTGTFLQQLVNLAPATAVYADNRQSDPTIYVFETYGGLRDNRTGLGNWTGNNLGPRASIFKQDGALVGEVGDQPEGLGIGQRPCRTPSVLTLKETSISARPPLTGSALGSTHRDATFAVCKSLQR